VDPTSIVLTLAVLFPSVILHEVAHGAVALHYGDDTAKRAGRLTLNPVAHVDLFGTILLPTLLAVSGAGAFGWAKPVPVNPSRMRRPRDHGLVVSLAGPATNIVLAVAAGLALRLVLSEDRALSLTGGEIWLRALVLFGVINVVLAAFNLLPIPPLDGSEVVARFLPEQWLPAWHRIRRYSIFVVLGVVLLVPGALDGVFSVALSLWQRLL
jgi:Zn-dependent protease